MARTSAKAKKLKQTGNNSSKTQKVEETASEIKVEEVDNQDAGDSTDKENDDVNYEVEKIVHTRVYRGKRQYLIRWKGYGEDSDTWENESTLQACPEALETFKNENSSLVDKSKGDSDNDGDDEETEDTQEGETKTKNKTLKVSKKVKSKMQNNKKAKKPIKESDEEVELDDNAQMEVDNEEKGKDLKKATPASKKNKGKRQKVKDEPSSKKPKSNDSDDESVTDGKNYEVEKILEVHTRKDKTREFLIRWKGFKPSEDTWEPEAHLDCQDLIDKFMEKVDKAKSIPARELREARAPAHKFVSHTPRSGRGVNLRNSGIRPCYQE